MNFGPLDEIRGLRSPLVVLKGVNCRCTFQEGPQGQFQMSSFCGEGHDIKYRLIDQLLEGTT